MIYKFINYYKNICENRVSKDSRRRVLMSAEIKKAIDTARKYRARYVNYDYLIPIFSEVFSQIDDIFEEIVYHDFRVESKKYNKQINGALFKDRDIDEVEYLILVSDDLNDEDVKIVAAHELGHYALKHLKYDEFGTALFSTNEDINYDLSEIKNIEERAATAFAMEFLISKNSLETVMAIYGYTKENVSELAGLFLVPVEFMRERIKLLSI